ncbi:hypothetical protein FHW16_004373 [Phyllobacterium myrsinacearum]|uniref:Uncharacterized protein n=1 Tax=Phyllobacterium myrsinacearum TaxID=28101 RepID=A0A839EVS4_9HYPH|nr:hypothetical protein [Phyllobacterium myrsinacearum]
MFFPKLDLATGSSLPGTCLLPESFGPGQDENVPERVGTVRTLDEASNETHFKSVVIMIEMI